MNHNDTIFPSPFNKLHHMIVKHKPNTVWSGSVRTILQRNCIALCIGIPHNYSPQKAAVAIEVVLEFTFNHLAFWDFVGNLMNGTEEKKRKWTNPAKPSVSLLSWNAKERVVFSPVVHDASSQLSQRFVRCTQGQKFWRYRTWAYKTIVFLQVSEMAAAKT